MFVGDRENDIRTERNVFFSETPTSQHHNVATPQRRSSPHTHTLTNTLTVTHTHDWPTVASRSSGSRGVFLGFCNLFFDQSGQQNIFWPPGGHVTSENIFLRVYKMFSFVYVYFLYAGIMLQI